MKKRVLALILAIAAALTLAACSGSDGDETGGTRCPNCI